MSRFPKILPPARAAATILALTAGAAFAGPPKPLVVTLPGLGPDGAIPEAHGFCVPGPDAPATGGPDRSPAVTWSAGPEGTRSYVLLATDIDVPARFDDANKPGRTIPADAPRQPFHHWVLADIPAGITALPAGAEGDGAVPRGKPFGPVGHGRRGVNDYGKFLASDPAMAGQYGGWDGPCPPWNDARIHHYRFAVHALDVPTLGLTGAFDGAAARAAMQGHVLAEGEAVGTYTLNPSLRK